MFDRTEIAAVVAGHGPVARVVVAQVRGSAPREVGAAMLVWGDGATGTIGGGALEWAAMARARAVLAGTQAEGLERMPLGPALGQCCGGAVTLLTEVWDAELLADVTGEVLARRVADAGGLGASIARVTAAPATDDTTTGAPLAVTRMLAQARRAGVVPAAALVQGWMVEPVAATARPVWVWGAGHVGRALVAVLAPLPGLAVTWVDVALSRFPADIPQGVTPLVAADPGAAVRHAPPDAEHLVLTFSHALDLELCHRILSQGFASLGVIGSATKAARFRARLRALGHSEAQVARMDCPIGEPALGKHPQAIAVGVAAGLLRAGAGVQALRHAAP